MPTLYSLHWWCWATPRGAWERGRCSRGPWRPPRGWVSGQTADTQTLLFGQTRRHGVQTEREKQTTRKSRTSVTAWMDAPCLSRSSITLALFFLQAMWSGVKPFCTHTHTQGERVRSVSSSEAALPAVTQGLWLAPRPLIGGWRGSEWFGRKWKGGAETRQRQTTRANVLYFLHCGCLKGFFKNPLNDYSLVATSFKPSTSSHITLYRLAHLASLMFGNFLFSQKWITAVAKQCFYFFFLTYGVTEVTGSNRLHLSEKSEISQPKCCV